MWSGQSENFSTLHVVVMAVPERLNHFSGRERETQISLLAQEALACSADFCGLRNVAFTKRENGAPKPTNGIHWSVAHAKKYVTAVTAPLPVGIDIEKIAGFSNSLKQRIATEAEWNLAKSVSPQVFYAFWTAKEAVLKAEGVGLKGLNDCRIVALRGDHRINVQYNSTRWEVNNQVFADDHIVAVTELGIPFVWHQL